MAELTQEKIFEAFGLGAQAQEVAAPAPEAEPADPAVTETGSTGAQVQEVAEPAAGDASPNTATAAQPGAGFAQPGEPADEGADGDGTGNEPMSAEQRRQNAARRRAQEDQARQTAINQAVQQARAEEQRKYEAAMVDFFKQANLKNTVTGAPIENMEQFRAWQSEFRMEQVRQNLQAGKLTQEDISHIVAENPVVKQAQKIVERSQAQEQQNRAAQVRAKIDGQIAEIGKLDPAIQTVSDLINMPNAKEFYDLVRGGKNFVEAFKLANFDRLTQQKAQAAKQQAALNNRGKDHLQAGGNNRGAGMATVPSADLAMYRKLMPEATDAEIQAHYNQYKKNR